MNDREESFCDLCWGSGDKHRLWSALDLARHGFGQACRHIDKIAGSGRYTDKETLDKIARAIQDAQFGISALEPFALATNRCTVVAAGNCETKV